MKAAYLEKHGSLEEVKVGELDLPEMKPGQVRVRLKYSSLNHLDIWVREGWPGLGLSFPHVLGSDGAGVVDEVGAGINRFRSGDEVIVHPALGCGQCVYCNDYLESLCPEFKVLGEHISGTNAEYVCVPESNLFRIPKGMSLKDASSLALVFTTAWHMLKRRAQVKANDLVLIHGAGSGVSMAGIQIAKLSGATVAVTSRESAKLEKAIALGADHLINTSQVDFTKELRKLKKAGADIIFDHVGEVYWEKNIKILRSGGTLVTCGATSGSQGMTDLKHVFYRQLSILGSTMGSKKDFPEIIKNFENGKFKAFVDKVFPLAQIKEAQTYLMDKKQCGKVVLEL